MVSKLKNMPEDRFRRRAVSLVPEVLDDEFSEQSFSKVEGDSQGSYMDGIDDIGYETEKDDIESPLDNMGGFQINQPI